MTHSMTMDPGYGAGRARVRPGGTIPRIEWIALAAILILTVIVYGQCPWFRFVAFDDDRHVYENTHVATGISLENIRWAFGIHGPSQWHPLAWISHQLDSQLFGADARGPDAGGHHAVNLLLHLCNVVLVYVLFRGVLQRAEPALLSAAIFAVHPLNVESVAWVSERRNVLCVAFSLATILAYLRYAADPRWQRYLPVACMLALALMAKPLAVTVPCVLCLLDYWPLRRIRGDRLPFLDKLPLFALAAISAWLTIKCQEAAHAVIPSAIMPLPIRLLNALAAYGNYLQAMIWPVRLCYFYPHPAIRHADPWKPLLHPALVGAALLAILTAVTIAGRRRFPGWMIGWFWFLGTLVPMIGLFQVGTQQRADRYLYFPMLGLLLALTAHLPWERWQASASRRRLWGASTVLVGLLAWRAWDQTATWRDSLTLFEHALTIDPRNKTAHVSAGGLRQERGEVDLAAKHFAAALDIDPGYAWAHYHAGMLLCDSGNVRDGWQALVEAVHHDPRCTQAWVQLGVLAGKDGRLDVAERCFKSACEADPKCREAWFNLGIALQKKRDPGKAREAFATALAIDPDFQAARKKLEQLEHDDPH